jgi:hypothetical protein
LQQVKKRFALAGLLLAGGVIAGSWLRTHERPSGPASRAESADVEPTHTAPPPRPLAPAAPRADIVAPAVPAAPPSIDPPSPVVALRSALAAGDDHDLVVAVEAAVEAKALDALPSLTSVDLRKAPHSAPAVIEGVAALAKEAGPRERREAATTLARWFREERTREGADAAGNTTTLIDALADTGQHEAVEALVAALDEHELPLNNETLIVQRLAELRQASAKPGIARFQARVAALPAAEGLEEELRAEALSAAREALTRLGG